MKKSQITYAVWPWGTKTREQAVEAARDITEIGYTAFESVKAAMYAFDLNAGEYKAMLDSYGLRAVSFYFHLPDVGDEEPDLDLDSGFDAEFNPDEFEPEDEPEEDSAANEINEIIASVGGTYFDNLQKEIQANQEANAGGTDEEKATARDEFVEKEAEAFAGLINVVTKPEETTEDDLLKSVDALLNSPVCKNTVSQSVENNPTFTETVQQATENLNEDIKSEIQQKLEASLETDPESAKDYQNIADLFGITLGSGITPEIPEGFNPDDYLG